MTAVGVMLEAGFVNSILGINYHFLCRYFIPVHFIMWVVLLANTRGMLTSGGTYIFIMHKLFLQRITLKRPGVVGKCLLILSWSNLLDVKRHSRLKISVSVKYSIVTVQIISLDMSIILMSLVPIKQNSFKFVESVPVTRHCQIR